MAGHAQANKNLKGIPASEILAKIENGESVKCHQVIVTGDLDLEKIN